MIGLTAGLSSALLAGCATVSSPATRQAVDLPAFQRVDTGLYRGGQPSPEGLRQLKQMGIRTIISLRYPTRVTDEEERLAASLGMKWVDIPMRYWWRPSSAQIRQFLDVASNPDNQPVFAHCHLGENRVGIMVAVYRVAQQHWTPAQAYEEGQRLGLARWNLLTRYILYREIPRTVRSR